MKSTTRFAGLSIAGLVLFLLFTSCEREVDKGNLKASIEKANQSWMNALRNKDASALADMYNEDAYILPPNVEPIQGRTGVKNFFDGAIQAGIREIKLVTEAVDGNDETAIEKGSYEMRGDENRIVDEGKYLVHWKKVDGKWMFQNDMFSSNRPAPSAPSLAKGNLLGAHVFDVKLKKGVTVDKFINYYNSTVIPGMEKIWPDVKIYAMRGVRGENKDRIGVLYYFASEDIRNKYFKDDGTVTAAGQEVVDKMTPMTNELITSYGNYTTKYTDWVVE